MAHTRVWAWFFPILRPFPIVSESYMIPLANTWHVLFTTPSTPFMISFHQFLSNTHRRYIPHRNLCQHVDICHTLNKCCHVVQYRYHMFRLEDLKVERGWNKLHGEKEKVLNGKKGVQFLIGFALFGPWYIREQDCIKVNIEQFGRLVDKEKRTTVERKLDSHIGK